jgi:hypothetical protein
LGQLGRDNDLFTGGGGLGVVALQGPAVAVHEPAVGVGGVDSCLGVGSFITPPGSDVGPGSLPTGPRGTGQLGHPLLVALPTGGRLGLQLGLGLVQPGQPLGPTSQGPWQLAAAAVVLIVSPVGLGGLGEQLGDLGLEVGVGAVGRRGGVGGDLGAVQGDQPQAHHAGRRAQLQRLDQQPSQGPFVADPEPGDGYMIRGAVAAHDAEGDVLVAAPLDLARGADAGAVAVQEYGQQHPRLVGGAAVPVGPIGLEEGTKVELVDDVEHEPGQVVGWQPLAHIGREQEGLVAVAGTEVVGHGRSYVTSLLCCLMQRPSQQPFPQL